MEVEPLFGIREGMRFSTVQLGHASLVGQICAADDIVRLRNLSKFFMSLWIICSSARLEDKVDCM